MGDAFGQLAAVSAVLGGFAVTFLSIVLTHDDPRRRVAVAVGVATVAAACFFLTALGWALLAASAAQVQSSDPAARAALVRRFGTALAIQTPVSQFFLVGVLLLAAMLGIGGWLRSRALGLFTTGVAVLTALAALFIMRPFITRRPADRGGPPNAAARPPGRADVGPPRQVPRGAPAAEPRR